MNRSVEDMKTTLDVVCGKWKAVLLLELVETPLRFSEIKKAIPRIPHQTLIKHLKELEQDGLINRVESDDVPPKVEYSLTSYGYALEPLLQEMEKWGRVHRSRSEETIAN